MSTSLDISIVGTWVAFLLALISLIGVIRAHFTSGTKENSEAIAELSAKHGKLDSRVQKIENKLEYLPSKDDLTQISIAIAKMEVELKNIARISTAAEMTARRVEAYLRKRGSAKND